MNPDYPHSYQQPQNSSKKRVVTFIMLGVAILVVASAVSFGVMIIVSNMANQQAVKDELIKQNTRLKAAMKDGALTTDAIESVASTDKIAVQLTPSTDLKSYCLEARSIKKTEIQYHMFQDTGDKGVIDGPCGDDASEPPSTPLGLTLGSMGATSLSLQWNPVVTARSYVLECNPQGASQKSTKETRTAMGTVEGLTPGTRYECRVSAQNSKGKSDWSEPLVASTEVALAIPKNLKITTQSSTVLNYSWEPVSGAQRYILEYATDPSFSQNVKQVTTTAASGSVTNLTAYTGYYFHVKAITETTNETQAPYSPPVQGRTAQ